MSSPLAPVRYNDTFAEKWVRDLSPPAWRERVDLAFREVPLASLEHAGCWTDHDVVQGWKRTLGAGDPIPPPVACLTERGTYYLHDGNHRLEALRGCLPSSGGEAVVRIAVAVPRRGFRFVRRQERQFFTYALESEPTWWRRILPLLLPLVTCIAAVVLTRKVPGVEAASPFFVLMLVAVLVCARFGGVLAGLVASVLNAIAAAFFFLPPRHSVLIEDPTHAVQFAVVALVMIVVSWLAGHTRRGAWHRWLPHD